MKLISTESLNNWIGNWLAKHKYYHPHSRCNSIPISELKDILNLMPEVESIPIEWINNYMYNSGVFENNVIWRMIQQWEIEKWRKKRNAKTN